MKIAGYARVSTQEQKLHGISIAAQEDALEEWGKAHGEYIGCYNDAGISARSRYTRRPALLRLLEDVRAKRVDLIIFTKLDRWFRNVGDYYEIQRILDDAGANWKAIWEDYETQTASGRLKVNIMLSVAQDEADRTSERIKRINAYRWASGDVAQKLPVGYRRNGKLVVIDEQTAPAVMAFFRTYLDTGSVIKAIEAAEALGLKVSREGASKMLRNHFFAGEVQGIKVPAYISEEEYELIQLRKALYARGTKRKRTYLFTGLLICGNCGARMQAQCSKNTHYYVCGKWQNRSGCEREKRGYTNERAIETWMLSHLEELHTKEVEIVKIQASQAPGPSKESVKKKIERVKDLYISGDIDLEEYRARKDKLEAQIIPVRPATDLERIKASLPTGWQETYNELSQEGKRAFWLRTVRQITFYQGTSPKVIFC